MFDVVRGVRRCNGARIGGGVDHWGSSRHLRPFHRCNGRSRSEGIHLSNPAGDGKDRKSFSELYQR